MASIITRPNGTREIMVCMSGNRYAIRLGHVTAKQAESAKSYVEDLAACKLTGAAWRNSTADWVKSLPEVIRSRIERAGLIAPQECREMPTLGGWIEAYLERRGDVKPGTMTNFGQVRDLLLEYFPADKPLDQITTGDAEDFGCWLRTERKPDEPATLRHRKRKLMEGTVRRHLKRCKQFFAAAIKREIIARNPFVGIKTSNFSEERFYFVSREEADLILKACPDTEWRLIFALARYAGLRIPSELLPLTWDDVNWERNRFTVKSPKTEHHEGKGVRVVPIFPELLPCLRESFEAARPRERFLITRHRDCNANLRTQLMRIIGRAGLKPWPKLFFNLRSTRLTELAETFPMHTVTSWLGNSPDVARKHYLQVTEDHFRRATEGEKSASESASVVAQNPHQSTAAKNCIGLQGIPDGEHNSSEGSALCSSSQSVATPLTHMH